MLDFSLTFSNNRSIVITVNKGITMSNSKSIQLSNEHDFPGSLSARACFSPRRMCGTVLFDIVQRTGTGFLFFVGSILAPVTIRSNISRAVEHKTDDLSRKIKAELIAEAMRYLMPAGELSREKLGKGTKEF